MDGQRNAEQWRVCATRIDAPRRFLPFLDADQRRYLAAGYAGLRCFTGLNASGQSIASMLAGTSIVEGADDSILYLLATGQESAQVNLDELIPHILNHAAEAGFTGLATSYLGRLNNRTIWAIGWMKSTRFPGWEYLGRDLMARLVELKWQHLGSAR